MKLPLLSGQQVLSALNRLDFVERHRKGSHVKMKHPDGRTLVFPYHKEIDRYTLKISLSQGDVNIKDFLNNI